MTTADYATELQTLSDGSTTVRFDAFRDIAWDAPGMDISADDPRWILVPYDPIAMTDWYKGLPREKQIEVGRWRVTNQIKAGVQFESMLVIGLQQSAMRMRNGSPEFRYSMHEMQEECNHNQMFQGLVNRVGEDVPGMPRLLRALIPIIPLLSYSPVAFVMAILAGEEPIDHFQKVQCRADIDMPPLVKRIMQIHIAEEARHISFAHKFITEHVARSTRFQRAVLGVYLPLIMRIAADAIQRPPAEFVRKFDVPGSAMRQAFWEHPEATKQLGEYFADVRKLAEDIGLLNSRTRWLWRRLGIDGGTARYRSQPVEFRRTTVN
ncbi:diiron oxygenase [Pseudonocardiaceae bacterium YIM PH 21723]|nr:diiron oxygenase [Pseudonocardiaceae bacterium YIM PH 21723]